MTPIIITLSLLISSKQGRINSGTDLGTGYGGTVCGFHTRPTFYPLSFQTYLQALLCSDILISFDLQIKD